MVMLLEKWLIRNVELDDDSGEKHRVLSKAEKLVVIKERRSHSTDKFENLSSCGCHCAEFDDRRAQ